MDQERSGASRAAPQHTTTMAQAGKQESWEMIPQSRALGSPPSSFLLAPFAKQGPGSPAPHSAPQVQLLCSQQVQAHRLQLSYNS